MTTGQLIPVGNTFRLVGAPVVCVALIVGPGLTSHFWLNILPLSPKSFVRFFVTESDLTKIAPLLHVSPRVVPSFLVFKHGFAIDWFPAPLPAANCAADPMALLRAVVQKTLDYNQVAEPTAVTQ